ncbi:MAG: Uma2 family endonuclease, partial [Cyclobacteriaceae bacterium]
AAKLHHWNEQAARGKVFESSAGFYLPNGAMRSPDCSFVSLQKWQKVREENPKNFPYLVPEFVVEVRTFSDTLNALQAKMQEWIDNGAMLGWLIDVQNKTIYVYRSAQEIVKIDTGKKLQGNDVLPGFSIDTDYIFEY